MPDIKLPWNGAAMFAPDRDEYQSMMREAWSAQDREQARTLKPLRFVGGPNQSIGLAASYTIPYTPNPGYIWNVRLVAVDLSAAAVTWWGLGDTPNDNTFIPAVAAVQLPSNQNSAETVSSGALFLNSGEFMTIWAASTITLVHYGLWVIESQAERLRDLIV